MAGRPSSNPNEVFLISIGMLLPKEEDNIPWMVENALVAMDEKEVAIVKLRFGLAGGYIYSRKEVAAIMRMTEPELRAIEKSAIAKARNALKGGPCVPGQTERRRD